MPKSKNSLRAVILTALEVEYMAVQAHLTDIKEIILPPDTIYECGTFWMNEQMWEVIIVEVGPGNTRAALEAQLAIQHFEPSVLFFVGVAGGVKDVKLGDVVAANKIYGYESGKAGEGFRPRPELGNSSRALVLRARAERRKKDWLQRIEGQPPNKRPKAFIGPIAAGEKVVTSTESVTGQFLRENYGDALAVEMEGFGFLKAAHAYPQVQPLVIRGISDLIDGKSQADAEGWQEIASRHASAFAFEVLAKFKPTRSPDPSPEPTDHGKSGYGPTATAPAPPPYFTGRRDILDKLKVALGERQATVLTALQGMGGIGKTTTAKQLAAEMRSDFPGGIFWGALPDHDGDPQPILHTWGRICGYDLSSEQKQKVVAELVRGFLTERQEKQGPLLVIIDDVRTKWLDAAKLLQGALPAKTSLLLTTRDEELAAALAPVVYHRSQK